MSDIGPFFVHIVVFGGRYLILGALDLAAKPARTRRNDLAIETDNNQGCQG